MPLLSSGSTVTLTVAPGQLLTVQSDQATFDFENPVGARVGEYAADTVFGPFATGGAVKLSSVQGALFYELAAGPHFNAPYDPSSVAITGGSINGKRVGALAMRPVQTQVLTAAAAGSPTITDLATGTSGIASLVAVAADHPCFTYLGANLAPWTPIPSYIACNSDVTNYMAVTFCTDAPVVELVMDRFNTRFMVEVDGQPALTNAIQLDSSGAADLVKIDFAGVRKARTFRVSGFNMPFGGINVGPTDSFWSSPDQRKLIAFLGDSYIQGTGANAQAFVWAATCARLMNYQFWLEGIGSTGYASSAPNSIASRNGVRMNALQRRVAGVSTNIQPDVVVWALGLNDAGGSMSAVQAGFDAGYASAATKPAVIVGPYTPVGVSGNIDTVSATVQAKAAQYGIAYNDIRLYVNSANKAVLTGGDNTHPTQIGHDYYGYRIAQDLLALGV